MYNVTKLNLFADAPVRQIGNLVNVREFFYNGIVKFCIIELVLSNAVLAWFLLLLWMKMIFPKLHGVSFLRSINGNNAKLSITLDNVNVFFKGALD